MLQKVKYICIGVLFIRNIFATHWMYCGQEQTCKGKGLFQKGYADSKCVIRQERSDWVCALDSGDEHDTRCSGTEKKLCQGFTAGDNDVPDKAWYLAVDTKGKKVKCNCGCFPHDVTIKLENEWVEIGLLAVRPQFSRLTMSSIRVDNQ